ncbi:hypothetical protein [Olsenella uli]|uniref:hypothetical protein n=1 Tax=Olsenella uli TaxID=133926 RepID=UPI0012AC37E3|nr:hypothetical protein [Olsenella uli]
MRAEDWTMLAALVAGGMSAALVAGGFALGAHLRKKEVAEQRKVDAACAEKCARQASETSARAKAQARAQATEKDSGKDGTAAAGTAERDATPRDASAEKGGRAAETSATASAEAHATTSGTPATAAGELALAASAAPFVANETMPSRVSHHTSATQDDSPAETALARRPSGEVAPAPELLDMDELAHTLLHADDAIAELKHLVGNIRTKEAHATDGEGTAADAVSSYLARGLDEAGLFAADADLPDVTVIRPSRSKTFYLRVDEAQVAWPDMVRVLAIEGALNRTLFAWEHLSAEAEDAEAALDAQALALKAPEDEQADDTDSAAIPAGTADTATPAETEALASTPDDAGDTPSAGTPTIEDCYRFNQALVSSIAAQVGTDPIPHASMSDVMGEWGVRQSISAGIETFRLPLRLVANFRVNLMGGDAAIVTKFVPAGAQPASVWSEELGRIVPASHQMREMEATSYALRCVLLLASHAFRCSRRLCHVFVAVVLDTPTRHACLLTGDVARRALRELDLARSFDAVAACRQLGLTFKLQDGALTEVEQGFSLDDERFCPSTRYATVDLSSRLLPRFEANLLGATRVSDLAINENAHRSEVARELFRELTPSTEKNVREILGLTSRDSDPSVVDAGRRTARALIDGSLSDDDAYGMEDEFVDGDELTRSCQRASQLLERNRAHEAVGVLTDALAPIDALDTYTDTDTVVWREFTSYVARTLYNRLLAKPGVTVRLVPDAYFGAQLLMATALMLDGKTEAALGFARRAQDLNPLDMSGTLRATRCLEILGRQDEAARELRHYLAYAFDPQGIGTCYYRLAFMEWHLGNLDVADACYQKAVVSRASCSGAAMLELQTMRAMTATKGVEPKQVEKVLEEADVPLAPTEKVVGVLVEAAQAATDAEVFPVARSFATLLGALSGDDVMHGVANSLEREPDR